MPIIQLLNCGDQIKFTKDFDSKVKHIAHNQRLIELLEPSLIQLHNNYKYLAESSIDFHSFKIKKDTEFSITQVYTRKSIPGFSSVEGSLNGEIEYKGTLIVLNHVHVAIHFDFLNNAEFDFVNKVIHCGLKTYTLDNFHELAKSISLHCTTCSCVKKGNNCVSHNKSCCFCKTTGNSSFAIKAHVANKALTGSPEKQFLVCTACEQSRNLISKLDNLVSYAPGTFTGPVRSTRVPSYNYFSRNSTRSTSVDIDIIDWLNVL